MIDQSPEQVIAEGRLTAEQMAWSHNWRETAEAVSRLVALARQQLATIAELSGDLDNARCNADTAEDSLAVAQDVIASLTAKVEGLEAVKDAADHLADQCWHLTTTQEVRPQVRAYEKAVTALSAETGGE